MSEAPSFFLEQSISRKEESSQYAPLSLSLLSGQATFPKTGLILRMDLDDPTREI